MSVAGVTVSRHSSQRPLSAILQDVRVLLVGLGSDTETCQALVKEMGGVVLGESDRNRAPTVVVARDVTTEKYQVIGLLLSNFPRGVENSSLGSILPSLNFE